LEQGLVRDEGRVVWMAQEMFIGIHHGGSVSWEGVMSCSRNCVSSVQQWCKVLCVFQYFAVAVSKASANAWKGEWLLAEYSEVYTLIVGDLH